MATDIPLVAPSDMGETIKMGAKQAGKYDVDVSKLDLPSEITGLSLQGTVLTITTTDGSHSQDLVTILPTVAADVFLKSVVRQANKLVFTVGEKDNTTNNTTFEVDVSDLLPVQADGTTITGNGTAANKLGVRISTAIADNLITKQPDGLAVSKASIVQIVNEVISATPAETRDIRFVNATGTTVLGYAHSSET